MTPISIVWVIITDWTEARAHYGKTKEWTPSSLTDPLINSLSKASFKLLAGSSHSRHWSFGKAKAWTTGKSQLLALNSSDNSDNYGLPDANRMFQFFEQNQQYNSKQLQEARQQLTTTSNHGVYCYAERQNNYLQRPTTPMNQQEPQQMSNNNLLSLLGCLGIAKMI